MRMEVRQWNFLVSHRDTVDSLDFRQHYPEHKFLSLKMLNLPSPLVRAHMDIVTAQGIFKGHLNYVPS